MIKERFLLMYFWCLALVMVGLAVLGGFRSFSPVPFWDMWDGYLNFFLRLSDGDVSLWWAQYNEHRILLSRLLFYIVLKWFNGADWILIFVNYVLAAFVILLFLWMLHDTNGNENEWGLRKYVGPFLVSWLFLWTQKENFTWGFQSQFFLAQLLPLLGFYLLQRSAASEQIDRNFVGACVAGLASAGSMANGVLALPLMMILALLTRQRLIKVTVLVVLSALELYLYFHNYTRPPYHGSLSHELVHNPLGLAQYVMLYLGGPFYYLSGGGALGNTLGQLAGFFLICLSIFNGWRLLTGSRKLTLQAALLLFILYIGTTALGTGGGRLIFGLDQALSFRYTTPSLMAWAALLVYFSRSHVSMSRRSCGWAVTFMVVLSVPMLAVQLKALDSKAAMLFERKVAALALELEVRDVSQLGSLYPAPDTLLTIAKVAKGKKLSVFGTPPIQNASIELGNMTEQIDLPVCQGFLDKTEVVDGDSRFIRVDGWIFDPANQNHPEGLRVIDNNGYVVGFAITGAPRPDVSAALGTPNANKAGFRGYVQSSEMGMKVYVQGRYNPSCQLQLDIPQ